MWSGSGSGSDDDDDDELARVVRRLVHASPQGGGGDDEKNESKRYADILRDAYAETAAGLKDLESETPGLLVEATNRLVTPLKIPESIYATMQKSLLGDDDGQSADDGFWSSLHANVVRPIVRVVVWLRSHFIRPVVLMIPEWIVVVYLVGRCVAVGMMALRIKAAQRRKASAMTTDVAFANIYAASAVVFGVISIILFAIMAGRSVSTAVVAVILSSAGVFASVLVEHVLRMADAPTFRSSETGDPATERRAMFLHGAAGLAFSAIVTAIPDVCPF